MHTSVSDGSDTPREIVDRVKEANIDVFSVTDHDATEACRIVRDLLKKGDPHFICGAEFSCKDKLGQYHILAYHYDPDAQPIEDLVEKGHRLRMKKVTARLDFVQNEFGFVFPKEEIEALLALDNPGKPHIGNLMVKYGYAENKEVAIRNYIDKLHFSDEYIKPEEAIESVLRGGGIPVLAHPFFGNGDQLVIGKEMEDRLKRLMDFGLMGVEAFYSGFTPKLTKEMLDFADRFGLLITAGSDYHGENKLVRLGETGYKNGTSFPSGLLKFLEACGL